jgi:hypothetical protein
MNNQINYYFFHHIIYTMTINNKALFLFLILLAGLVLCSFLLGNCMSEGFDPVPTYTGVNLGKTSNKSTSNPSLGGQGNVYMGTTKNPQSAAYDNYNHYSGTATQMNNPNSVYAKKTNDVISQNTPANNDKKSNVGSGMSGTSQNNPYSSSLSKGIPASKILPGQEDLYILKSEIVPPVCPMCPSASLCERKEKCPPCPACARCPEPSFECKKVPNYNSASSEFLPVPVLNRFSTFGM